MDEWNLVRWPPPTWQGRLLTDDLEMNIMTNASIATMATPRATKIAATRLAKAKTEAAAAKPSTKGPRKPAADPRYEFCYVNSSAFSFTRMIVCESPEAWEELKASHEFFTDWKTTAFRGGLIAVKDTFGLDSMKGFGMPKQSRDCSRLTYEKYLREFRWLLWMQKRGYLITRKDGYTI